PIPYELYEKHKIRRYGFHGTSHRYVAAKAAEMLGNKNAKIITCHLGNGSSITATVNGKAVDTSMGFTPQDGVPMGTPSCGVKPIDVSTVFPFIVAVIEELLPRWQVMIFASFLPSISAVFAATYLCDVPWKP
ncbi:MAG: hypothetical protein IJY34_00040, partial [Clostridia bacterium]|nr:hypothetical protein [Clostridia bacterium]